MGRRKETEDEVDPLFLKRKDDYLLKKEEKRIVCEKILREITQLPAFEEIADVRINEIYNQITDNKKIKETIKKPFDGVKKCLKIVSALRKNPLSLPFLEPVDPEVFGIPNYFEVIKDPMDLSTVEDKLRSQKYENHDEFVKDVNLIWTNARTFNPEGHRVHEMAKTMELYFEELLNKKSDDIVTVRNQADKCKKKLKDIDEKYNGVKKYHNGST